MDTLAPVIRCVIAPLWAKWERSPYLRLRRDLAKTQYDSPEKLRAGQLAKLQVLCRHACDTAEFWRRRFREAGVTPSDVRSLDDLRRLPVLTKHDLRSKGTELLSSSFGGRHLHRKLTSGSTGVSVEIFVDDDAQQFKRACTLRADEWSGWRQGERTAVMWGHPQPQANWKSRLRRAILERTYACLDTLAMNEQAMSDFADTLVRKPPSLLFGHAHSLHLFATHVNSRKPEVAIRPRGIISTSMVLHDWERRTIEDVFQCPVTNRYGCEEVSLIACECEEHNGMHINADGVVLEILRDNGTTAAPGELGRIVVSDLVNRAMPLFRYEVGDVGCVTDRRCACGRGLPLLDRVEGRIADYVITSSGQMISGISLTDHFAALVPGVSQFQIVQEDLDRFIFRMVKEPSFNTDSEAAIRRLAAERFGEAVRYECQFVDRIANEPSGKYRFCISKVPRPYSMGNQA